MHASSALPEVLFFQATRLARLVHRARFKTAKGKLAVTHAQRIRTQVGMGRLRAPTVQAVLLVFEIVLPVALLLAFLVRLLRRCGYCLTTGQGHLLMSLPQLSISRETASR